MAVYVRLCRQEDFASEESSPSGLANAVIGQGPGMETVTVHGEGIQTGCFAFNPAPAFSPRQRCTFIFSHMNEFQTSLYHPDSCRIYNVMLLITQD